MQYCFIEYAFFFLIGSLGTKYLYSRFNNHQYSYQIVSFQTAAFLHSTFLRKETELIALCIFWNKAKVIKGKYLKFNDKMSGLEHKHSTPITISLFFCIRLIRFKLFVSLCQTSQTFGKENLLAQKCL